MAKGDRQNPYALTQLYCELTWAPYWKDAFKQQLDILTRAAHAIRAMSTALDEIERIGTHVLKDGMDPQVRARAVDRLSKPSRNCLLSVDFAITTKLALPLPQ
jgi:hypothetical protein